MGEELPAYPLPDEIMGVVSEVVAAAVRRRGVHELLYVDPDGPDSWLAGTLVSTVVQGYEPQPYDTYVPSPGGTKTYAMSPEGRYRGTSADFEDLKIQYTWVSEAFESRLDPDPVFFQRYVEDLGKAAVEIYDENGGGIVTGQVSRSVDGASDLLIAWRGPAANAFKGGFLSKLEYAAQNQGFYAGALMHAMIAERDIFVQARHDLLNVAKQTLNAIETFSSDKDPEDIDVALKVFTAVTVIGAGIATIPVGGVAMAPGIAAGLTILSGIGAGASVLKPSGSDIPLNAGTVDGVLSNMMDNITRMEETIDSAEQEVSRTLKDIQGAIQDALKSSDDRGLLLPPEPAVAIDL